ncbi:RDD family protein [Maribellus sp. CM-23]|uniref:RDD family protein n=1 Tax=Maribellus sp. CM-23 TaxID=2781026 RepID=UPI001F271E8D|nr:RDD family protein [Maribellus sp. CM-23]MCE4563009.1 RDD family protein [Maribellus sp. CM-23]
MTAIKIQTAQNTLLYQTRGSLGERMIASLLDAMVMGAYALIGTILSGIFSMGTTFMAIFLLPVYFYTLLLELLFDGQTLGKMVMKIKVVHSQGQNIPFTSYLLRWILRLVDIWILFASVGVVTILFSKKGQRVGDIAADTLVISIKPAQKLQELRYTQKPSEEKKIVFSQVSLLDDKDIEVIREVLAYGKEAGFYGNAAKMLKQTSSTMQKKLGIETNMIPVKFLEQLLDDYYLVYA